MTVITGYARCVLMASLLLAVASAHAQDELRATFFKEADAALAAADAVNAKLLAPRSYERGYRRDIVRRSK